VILKWFSTAPATLRGMAFMLVSAVASAALNATARHLSAELHPLEIVFFRSLFGFLIFVPVFVRSGFAPLRTRRLGLHVARGTVMSIVLLLFFTGLATTPLAKATALGYSSPLFATLLAAVVLGEAMRVRRVATIVVGFLGALLILRPGIVGLEAGPILVLLSSAISAVTMILVKLLSRTESALTTTIYMGVVTTPLTLIAAIPVWETPTLAQLGGLAFMGGLAGLIHFSVAQAFRESDMTAVLPVNYTSLLWAAIIGFLAFGEVPDIWTWIGGAIIVAAILHLAYRERGADAPPAKLDTR